MSQIHKWFLANKLTLSTDKSCFIIFRTAQSQLNHIQDELNFNDKALSGILYFKIDQEKVDTA